MKAGREAEEICAIGSLPPTRWAHIPLFLWVEHELGRSYHISRLLRTSCAQRGCPGDLQYVRMLTTTSRWGAPTRHGRNVKAFCCLGCRTETGVGYSPLPQDGGAPWDIRRALPVRISPDYPPTLPYHHVALHAACTGRRRSIRWQGPSHRGARSAASERGSSSGCRKSNWTLRERL